MLDSPSLDLLLDNYDGADLLVVVKFKSIGSAPIMKTTVFKVTASNRFQAVIVFLRGQIGLKASDPLVCSPPGRREYMTDGGSLHISMERLRLLLMISWATFSK